MNHLSAADVDTRVGAGLTGVALGVVEEDQIAGLKLAQAVHPGAQAALPLAGGRVGQGDAELLVHIHGETGAVEAAGGRAAVAIPGAQELAGKVHDAAVTHAGAGGQRGFVGQADVVAPDIALAVGSRNVVPAVFNASDRDAGAQAQVIYNFAVNVGLGPDIDAPGIDPPVVFKLRILAHCEEVGGDIAVVSVVGHVIPSVGLAQNGNGPVLVQHGEDGGVQRGIGPEAEGGAGGLADADYQGVALGGEGRDGQKCHGDEGECQNSGGLSCKSIHGSYASFLVSFV